MRSIKKQFMLVCSASTLVALPSVCSVRREDERFDELLLLSILIHQLHPPFSFPISAIYL